MPDEKRIKDFEPASELLIDDWFAVDSPSQGTRKMQASMFQQGLQTQITANTEAIALHSGQITTLQQGVGNIGDKVDVLSAAITVEEYSATSLYAVDDDCVYEGVRYKCITAIETPEAFDSTKWQAISVEGELNELNSSKENKIKKYYRNGTTNISTSTGNLFSCAFSIKYTNDMVISFACRVLVQNVPAGVTNNPVITISGLPNDIPAFEGVGALTQKGTDSTEVGDGCTFSHAQGSTSMTVYSFNFMGTARTGWVCYTVPGVY